MKKLLVALFASAFLITPPAQADTPVTRIVDKPHTNFEGEFRNNELATNLLPAGKLGKLIFGQPLSSRTYVIDAALIKEVLDMADGYSYAGKEDLVGEIVAKNWLAQLKFVTVRNTVVALPFGNPDEKLLKSIAPSELKFYSQYAQDFLEAALNRPVLAQNGWGSGVSRLSDKFINSYTQNRKLLTGLSTIVSSEEITDLLARLAVVMNPILTKDEQAFFTYNEKIAVKKMAGRLKVIPGRYQITTTEAKLPITLVNNFDTAAVVNVSLIPMNSRIQIENLNNITIAPKSRQQILLPVDVIAPGSTLVLAQLMNFKGQLVGEVSKLHLTATIIDSRVAWFTTGAAVLLFMGAVTQSVRRVRRSRK